MGPKTLSLYLKQWAFNNCWPLLPQQSRRLGKTAVRYQPEFLKGEGFPTQHSEPTPSVPNLVRQTRRPGPFIHLSPHPQLQIDLASSGPERVAWLGTFHDIRRLLSTDYVIGPG